MRPAHSSEAACAAGQSPGIGKQKRSSATAYSAKPPSMSQPRKRPVHRGSRGPCDKTRTRRRPTEPGHADALTAGLQGSDDLMAEDPRRIGDRNLAVEQCRSVRQVPQRRRAAAAGRVLDRGFALDAAQGCRGAG
jgi:hypothetical protein